MPCVTLAMSSREMAHGGRHVGVSAGSDQYKIDPLSTEIRMFRNAWATIVHADDWATLAEMVLGIQYKRFIVFKWASYQIRKIAGCACTGNVFPVTDFKGNR